MTPLWHFTFTSSASVEFSSIWRWPGTTPVSQALPWALAWSTILCCPSHTGSLSWYSRAGRHLRADIRLGATNNMSQFRWFHTRRRRVLLRRPAGLSITVDNPMRRSHHPRAFAPSWQQCYEVTIDGPMQFAFANPLRLPASGRRVTVTRRCRLIRGLPTLRQAACRTLW